MLKMLGSIANYYYFPNISRVESEEKIFNIDVKRKNRAFLS